jgi:hypothetical protein
MKHKVYHKMKPSGILTCPDFSNNVKPSLNRVNLLSALTCSLAKPFIASTCRIGTLKAARQFSPWACAELSQT